MDAFSCLACGCRGCEPVCDYLPTHPPHAEFFPERKLVECNDCHLLQIDRTPPAERLSEFYSTVYRKGWRGFTPFLRRYPYDSKGRMSRARSLRKLAEPYLSGDDPLPILEIGAGLGYNLFAFRELYSNCSLVANEGEPECQAALAKLGAAIIPGLWGQPEVNRELGRAGPFDVVILSHVLEHSMDPRRFICDLNLVLSDRSVVVLEVPNTPRSVVESEAHSPHLTFFERSTLRALLLNCGVEPLVLDSFGPLRSAAPKQKTGCVRRIVRALVPFSVRLALARFRGRYPALSAAQIRDINVVPSPSYLERGGDNRHWLRAVFRLSR